MKCQCGNKTCQTELSVDTVSHTITMDGPESRSIVIYLDANTCAELIRGLRRMLLNFAWED